MNKISVFPSLIKNSILPWITDKQCFGARKYLKENT